MAIFFTVRLLAMLHSECDKLISMLLTLPDFSFRFHYFLTFISSAYKRLFSDSQESLWVKWSHFTMWRSVIQQSDITTCSLSLVLHVATQGLGTSGLLTWALARSSKFSVSPHVLLHVFSRLPIRNLTSTFLWSLNCVRITWE